MTNSQSRKHRGYATQAAVACDLAASGIFPKASSAGAGRSGVDVLHTPGWAIEVKARGKFEPLRFMRQASSNRGDDIPICVIRSDKQGLKSIGEWLVLIAIDDIHVIASVCHVRTEKITRRKFDPLEWVKSKRDQTDSYVPVAFVETIGGGNLAALRWSDLKRVMSATVDA